MGTNGIEKRKEDVFLTLLLEVSIEFPPRDTLDWMENPTVPDKIPEAIKMIIIA